MSASLHINFGGNFWQTQGFSVGRTASVGDTSARAANAGFARGSGAEGGENPSRLFLAAFGTF
jgi:cystathionine beta-lyase family protein involved in aluminum resistance